MCLFDGRSNEEKMEAKGSLTSKVGQFIRFAFNRFLKKILKKDYVHLSPSKTVFSFNKLDKCFKYNDGDFNTIIDNINGSAFHTRIFNAE